MTGTYVVIEPTELQVVPGAEQTCLLTVHNTGALVESYDLQALGDVAAWTSIEPSSIMIYPGTEATATVRLAPPRSAGVPVGRVPFAVRAVPSGRLDEAVAPEAVADIQPFTDTIAELTPRTSRGLRRGRHEVAIDNRGNTPVRAVLTNAEPDDQLAVRIRPSTMDVPPGQTTFVSVTVRPTRLRWQGGAVTQPFRIEVRTGPSPAATPDQPAPPPGVTSTLDGRRVQTAVLSKGTGRLLGAIAVLAVLATAAWYLLLRPAVRSAAQDAIDGPLAQVASTANQAQHDADKANRRIDTVGATQPASKPPPPRTSKPFTARLDTQAGAGSTSVLTTYRAPAHGTLSLTDLFLENLQGDTGRLDLVVDTSTMLTLSLVNFRDNDYHFVTPIEVPVGKTFGIRIVCQSPGPPIAGNAAGQCRVALLAGGLVVS